VQGAALLVGFVDRNQGRGKPFHNAAALLQPGAPIAITHKSLLPTYDVFDEDRYFEPARTVVPLMFGTKKIGVTICEDIWTEHYLPRPLYDVEPVRSLVEQGAELILNLSASPFGLGKPAVRREMVATLARTYNRPICYCNAVGGNDQLVFDGNSIAMNSKGELIAQLPAFRAAEEIVETETWQPVQLARSEDMADLFEALSLGLRDYLTKCNFKSAVLGLSGGIDSAVVAAVAVNALGAKNVVGVVPAGSHCRRLHHLQSPVHGSLCRPPGGHDGGKYAGALARNDPDGALEQIWTRGAQHRKQERTSRRLLHSLRRHGRGPGGNQRCAKNHGLCARPLD
jgi:predicted amidohydrolase